MGYSQFATTTQFYLFGKRHCTLTGWERARKLYPKPDLLEDPSLSLAGKNFMVTGANAGIGREITRFLASKGATVWMVCRNAQRAEKAREQIAQEAKCDPSTLQLLQCDCSLEADVRKAWTEFSDRQKAVMSPGAVAAVSVPRLDGLICNAGALLNERTLTSEGVETTFAAHLLFGTYLLGSLAMPALEATPGSRLVVVSSGGMYNTKFPAWDVATSTGSTAYDGQFAYAFAKRGQVLLCERWSAQHPKVKVVSCHPGWTLTEGVEAAYGEKKSYLEPLRSLWQGAEGICWLCVAPPSQIEGGSFYLDRSPQPKHLSGPFFSEGSYTKNTSQEVDEMMRLLDLWSTPEGRANTQLLSKVLQIKQRLSKPLQASATPLELQGFMGRWYVLANIPMSLEVGARNCIENYKWDEQRNGVDILFEYVPKGAADTAPSSMSMRAAIANAPTNTHWSLSPKILGLHWPLGLAYLVVHVSDDGSWCVIGEPKRNNLWIMTREKPRMGAGGHAPVAAALSAQAGAEGAAGAKGAGLSAEGEAQVLKAAIAKAKEEGYDTAKVVRIEWTV